MKFRLAACSVALLAAAAPSFAQVVVADPPTGVVVEPARPGVILDAPVLPRERIYVPAVRPSGAVHGGYVTFDDERLLGEAVSVLSADRSLNNMTVTMVAKNGELIVNGYAKDAAQAARIERTLRRVANGRVTARFDHNIG